jgi:hypothetical protein
MMIFPDSHRYELFPRSETRFFVVTWNKMNERFQVQFAVNFGVDEATGLVLYMDFVFGPGHNYVRNERLGLKSFVPYIPTPVSSATSLAATPSPPVPAPDAGFPWGWTILPVALLAAAGWAVVRQRRSTRR